MKTMLVAVCALSSLLVTAAEVKVDFNAVTGPVKPVSGVDDDSPLFRQTAYRTAFNELCKRGQAVKVTTDGTPGFHATAAVGKGTAAVMLANDTDKEVPLKLDLGDWTVVQTFITDAKRTAAEVALPAALPSRSFAVVTLGKVRLVQDVKGYNSWPMMQAIGKRLVCTYCRGKAHNITEGVRGVFARASDDGGRTWTPEVCVVNEPDQGESTIGKGLDENGAMLLWVRSWGKQGLHHDLYRTADGVKFELVTQLRLNPNPMQITDVFTVPGEGLVALWFAGYYKDDGTCSWGKITSADNGKTWKQETIEKGLKLADWPTEPSAAYLGNGRIIVLARTESGGKCQFQITSTDNGKTWKRTGTNITKINGTTPSLIYDKDTGLLYHYIYHRGPGLVKRRVVNADYIFTHPMEWPDYEALASGSKIPVDSGNANATQIGKKHYITYYSGKKPDTAIYITESDVSDFKPQVR